MHKYEVLRLCAEEFRLALEKYSKEDQELKSELTWFLDKWMPWYHKVMNREIRLPCYEYRLDVYFVNPDVSKIAIKYHYENPKHPLNLASTCFWAAMRDRYSDPINVQALKQSNESLHLIPDEPPPLDEETPLPETKAKSAPPHGNGWLYRWIFGEWRK